MPAPVRLVPAAMNAMPPHAIALKLQEQLTPLTLSYDR